MTAKDLLPHNAEYENLIIGYVLLNGSDGLEEVTSTGLESTDFYDPFSRTVYRRLLQMAVDGKPIDLMTAKTALQESGEIADGDLYKLASLGDGLSAAVNVKHYAEEIIKAAKLRRLAKSSNGISKAILRGDDNLEKLLPQHRGIVDSIAATPDPEGHDFEEIGEDRFKLSIPIKKSILEVDRVRWERNKDLMGELCVQCELPGVRTYNGILSSASFNLSSARARSERAKQLSEQTGHLDIDWDSYLNELSIRTKEAIRRGKPAVDLRTVPEPAADEAIFLDGIKYFRSLPIMIFGDGGTTKSYTGLRHAGLLNQRGLNVAYCDWEFEAASHKTRLRLLFGADMPQVFYARCDKPLVHEIDRLVRIVQDEKIDYVFLDSVAAACDGPPEAAEVATAYFRAVRRLGSIGTCHLAHITKGGDTFRPFGSIFWSNNNRATYYVEKTEENADGSVIALAFHNRKVNVGARRHPVALRVSFEDQRTVYTPVAISQVSQLTESLSIKERMLLILRNGPMGMQELAEALGAKADTVRRTAQREKGSFTILENGNVALLQVVKG
jgi:hypothetical protein